MTGYVRNDVTDQIANGNTVDAIPLDGEFNAIQAAFAAVGGHAHTGAVGEGAPITTIGPAQEVVASANSLTPKIDDAIDLGSSSFEWRNLWIDGTANIDSLVADTADINGGTVDAVVIGATIPAAATFTTMAATSGTLGGVSIATVSGTQTLTGKTLNLTNNTLIATSAQLRAAVTDETGAGALVFADSPAFAGTPTAPTAVAGTNTTQVATTAHVFAERSNTATLTNKTLTSPTVNTPAITGGTISGAAISGGSVSGITDLAVADGGTGVSTITGIIRGNGTSPFTAAVAGTDFLAPAAIGVTVQAFDADLSAVAGLSTNGFIARTGAGTAATRTLTAGTGISITNGDGVAGNPVISLSNSGVPSGAVMAFAMSSPPAGWLKCNGAAVSRTTYANLFAAIGNIFGPGDGSTTFNLPDLRGEFVRGWADDRAVDTGRPFGTAQAQEIQAHTHTTVTTATTATNVGPGGTVLATASSGNTGSTGGTETRPRNIAMLYCIKT